MPREHFSPTDRALLAPYVTPVDGQVFALRNLPQEVVAVLFAYYSRSPGSLRQHLLKLIKDGDLASFEAESQPHLADTASVALTERARRFHEKWVIGYGHSSVAEHAVVHLAVENVSILASKAIENTRLASFTEKSSRYTVFDARYAMPELDGTAAGLVYQRTVGALLSTYTALLPQVMAAMQTHTPRPTSPSACRGKALDLLRYLLPAGALTHLGMTINARALAHLVRKLMSHPLPEVQRLGSQIKRVALGLMPTLLRYAKQSAYLADTHAAMQRLNRRFEAPLTHHTSPEQSVTLVQAPSAEAEAQLVAAILYGYSNHGWEQLLSQAKAMSLAEKALVVQTYVQRRGPHDAPLRALEHLTYTFELLIDYGAYRDIQRHRMGTQTLQGPSPTFGYTLPEDLEAYGFGQAFKRCMQQAHTAYEQIGQAYAHLAPYVLPLAFRCRVVVSWNLRQLYHVVQLRSAKQGHAAYRRIAQQVYLALKRTHPLMARYMRVDLHDYTLARL